MTCPSCGRPLDHDAHAQRVFCSAPCRQRAYRARKKAHTAAAHDLVMRQTRAYLAGDLAAMAEIQREAARLFG